MKIIGNDLVIDYPVIDADSHVNEPPDLWQKRVPAKFRERAPKVVPFEGGDAWSFDNGKQVTPVGATAQAGNSVVDFRWAGDVTYEKMRPGSFDPKARLEDQDLDGIAAQLLYPSVTLSGARAYGDDPALQAACTRAYNEWLAEFCGYAPDRLYGLALIPETTIENAVAEAKRAIDLKMRGVLLGAYPNGSLNPSPEDAAFWDLISSAGLPAHIHLGSFSRGHGDIPNTMRMRAAMAAGLKSGTGAQPVAAEFLYSGIFDEFPELNVVLVEGNIGWIPVLLEQADDMHLRYRFANGPEITGMKMLPSEYFYRNMWSTFMIDTVGMELRYRCGIDHIMWSTDYPHGGADWPNSRVTMERNFRGLPYNDVRKMAHENVKGLYKLNVPSSVARQASVNGAQPATNGSVGKVKATR